MKVLIVEDEDIVRTLLAAHLDRANYAPVAISTCSAMLERLRNRDIDLVILDLGLPDEDGLVALRQLRMSSDVPVLILTSRDDPAARHAALELGADDYISKSVQPEEIVLRVRNILARAGAGPRQREHADQAEVLEFSGWRMDLHNRVLRNPDGKEIALTGAEFETLSILVRARGRVLTRDQLLDGLPHQSDSSSDRTIDTFVSRIRRKMGKPSHIVTVTGLGYRFDASFE